LFVLELPRDQDLNLEDYITPSKALRPWVDVKLDNGLGNVRFSLFSWGKSVFHFCLCGSLAQCALSLKRLAAGPGFNAQTRQNCFRITGVHALRLISWTGKRVWRCPL